MKVRAYDNDGRTFDRYTIIINKNVYLMSHNPTSAQGVCMYYGRSDSLLLTDRPVKIRDLPTGVQLKIYDLGKG
jgi:hypothetical protein